jgi:hypothetical protein
MLRAAPPEDSEGFELRADVAADHENRLEVTCPFRVLSGNEVAEMLGFPLPVRPQHSQNAWPSRYSFLRPCPETRLSEQSSRGVRPSFTACLESSATGISAGSTSHGVSCPFNASGGESPRPVLVVLRLPLPASPVLPGWYASRSHPASYGAAPRFSQPHSGFFLSPPSRHFQTGGVRGVCPTGVCSLREASTTRRRRHALMTFLPQAALPPS